MKNNYVVKHQQLLRDRFEATATKNDGILDINVEDINNLNIATYNMGTDTGYDNALDDIEKLSTQVAACGAGIIAGGVLMKAVYAKFFK